MTSECIEGHRVSEDTPGRWIRNRRFRYITVGGATVVRLKTLYLYRSILRAMTTTGVQQNVSELLT